MGYNYSQQAAPRPLSAAGQPPHITGAPSPEIGSCFGRNEKVACADSQLQHMYATVHLFRKNPDKQRHEQIIVVKGLDILHPYIVKHCLHVL